MAFVDDDNRVEFGYIRYQRRAVSLGNIHILPCLNRLNKGKILILPIGFGQFLLTPNSLHKRIDPKHKDGQLLAEFRKRDTLSHQCRLFIDHPDGGIKQRIELLTVRVLRIVQIPVRLFQYGI